ncbi:MAG: hypothetical protein JWP36_1669 [Paucimonas sp.]|nr:hypothetical protein [Paucimonas sp.]
MTESEFELLCREVCDIFRVEDPQQLGQRGYLLIDGIPVGLMMSASARQLYCYADLGPVARHMQALAYEQLLVENQLNMSKTAGCYGIEPATGHAVFTVAMTHAGPVEAAGVARAMQDCARNARQLRNRWQQQAALHAAQLERPGEDAADEPLPDAAILS